MFKRTASIWMRAGSLVAAGMLCTGFALQAAVTKAGDKKEDNKGGLPADLATGVKMIKKSKWSQASKEAKEKKLPVMIRFSDEVVCKPCQIWDKDVFSKPEVKNNAGAFCVVLDYELAMSSPSKDCKDAKQKYQVKGFPTVLMVDADGKLLDSNGTSNRNPQALLQWMKKHSGK